MEQSVTITGADTVLTRKSTISECCDSKSWWVIPLDSLYIHVHPCMSRMNVSTLPGFVILPSSHLRSEYYRQLYFLHLLRKMLLYR